MGETAPVHGMVIGVALVDTVSARPRPDRASDEHHLHRKATILGS